MPKHNNVNNRLRVIAGTAVHFGSRTQAVVALSAAESESELRAIGTGATEALHLRDFLQEALSNKTVVTRIHTDSTAGKSFATRVGSKKAKHIELKHFCTTTGTERHSFHSHGWNT